MRPNDRLIGMGWQFNCLDKTTRPHLALLPGVAEGLAHELKVLARHEEFPLERCSVTLYTGLGLSAVGSEGAIIYHANPSIDQTPWYDDILLLRKAGSDHTPPVFNAGMTGFTSRSCKFN